MADPMAAVIRRVEADAAEAAKAFRIAVRQQALDGARQYRRSILCVLIDRRFDAVDGPDGSAWHRSLIAMLRLHRRAERSRIRAGHWAASRCRLTGLEQAELAEVKRYRAARAAGGMLS